MKSPCGVCPYRRDVPSGIWEAIEYDKLVAYDPPTSEQPMAPFACHADSNRLCHGWAVCHSSRGHECELLALRILGVRDVPEPAVPLFRSGQEAADHGKRDVSAPKRAARERIEKLVRKHPRLRQS